MWRIRKLVRDDIPGVLAIQASCPEMAQWTATDYERIPGDTKAWVADGDDAIAGFLVVRTLGQETEILNIAVRRDVRRHGVGSMLLSQAIEWSKGLGAGRVLLEVRESNGAALKFYQRNHFRAAGQRRAYYAAPAEDALLLDLRL
ncbi:MAG TPA: ribosomal protein S18-alanine N-acetyltransferase [Candidatus Acidoferrales bacterium]|nr:ribosomal protein S18-alanine N-acetyltransferase [Candidatus Acidoferrales bacterium]